ncbi:MAG: hypothetical protein K9L32_09015 [Chromatiaceae bacterium]|nr:hypothetical protein [Chromatiaceae bacterium]MCF8004329.1 hypothetical protein [Chromatiaceae bacterium]
MMDIVDIDLQRVSLGALIIALALMVDDAMTRLSRRAATRPARNRKRMAPSAMQIERVMRLRSEIGRAIGGAGPNRRLTITLQPDLLSGIASTYGAAASLLVILFWVYFSALLLLLGVALTRAELSVRNRPIVPRASAMRVVQRQVV